MADLIERTLHRLGHCRTPEDVQSAIRAARDSQLLLSVRGGGHDWAEAADLLRSLLDRIELTPTIRAGSRSTCTAISPAS